MATPMMSNLEGIPYNDVINSEGLSYTTFRETLKPDYFKTWLHIILGLLCLAALLFIFVIIENKIPGWYLLTIPVCSILTGFTIAFINLFVHEAGHYYLYPDKKTNDLLANIFLHKRGWFRHIFLYQNQKYLLQQLFF